MHHPFRGFILSIITATVVMAACMLLDPTAHRWIGVFLILGPLYICVLAAPGIACVFLVQNLTGIRSAWYFTLAGGITGLATSAYLFWPDGRLSESTLVLICGSAMGGLAGGFTFWLVSVRASPATG